MDTTTITLLGLAIFGWGTATFFDKVAVSSIGPKTVFIVYLTGGIITLVYFLLSGKATPIGPSNGVMAAIAAGVLISVAGVGFYTALQREQVSLAVPFAALYPAITVILGVLLLHEELKLVNVIGIILALIAGVLLSL